MGPTDGGQNGLREWRGVPIPSRQENGGERGETKRLC